MRDPKTPAEWRQAVALAEACLLLDSARQYGLVTGGPGVDAERCEDILRRGAEQGIRPTHVEVDEAIRRLLRDMTAQPRRG